MNHRLPRLAVAVGIVAASFVALGAARRILLPLPEDRCRSSRFDAAAWQDSTLAHSAARGAWVRGCMIDDLLDRQLLPGRSRPEVVQLLGEPRPSAYFREYDLVYWLGPERGLMSLDSEWLVLRFGADGRVAEARLVTD